MPKGPLVDTGLYLKRLLWRAAEKMGLRGRDCLAVLGVTANHLASFKDCPGGSLRRDTMASICWHTNMRASELDPHGAWAKEFDELLASPEVNFSPGPKASLRARLGNAWKSVCAAAAEDVRRSTPVTLAGVDADPLTAAVHQLIASNALPRGEVIDVYALMVRFNARPSDMEAALKDLGLRQVVMLSKGDQGQLVYRVSNATPDEGRQIMFIRSVVEAALVEKLREDERRAERVASMLEQAARAMARDVDIDDSQAFINDDIAFHLALAEGQQYLQQFLKSLMAVIHTAVPGIPQRNDFQRKILEEHREIVAAVRDCDYDRGVALLKAHIEGAGQQLFRDTPPKLVRRRAARGPVSPGRRSRPYRKKAPR